MSMQPSVLWVSLHIIFGYQSKCLQKLINQRVIFTFPLPITLLLRRKVNHWNDFRSSTRLDKVSFSLKAKIIKQIPRQKKKQILKEHAEGVQITNKKKLKRGNSNWTNPCDSAVRFDSIAVVGRSSDTILRDAFPNLTKPLLPIRSYNKEEELKEIKIVARRFSIGWITSPNLIDQIKTKW